MRVIGGIAKGRRLNAPSRFSTRPSMDRVRESTFDMLSSSVCGQNVLDIFAGSGAVGIEALSRGAKFCVFVDASKQAVQVIRENLLKVGFEKQAKIMRSDVIRFFKHWHGSYAFDLVFVDPPYGKAWVCRTLELLQQWQFIAPCARVVCEIEYRVELPESFGQLHICWYKRYGNTVVCVYSAFAK